MDFCLEGKYLGDQREGKFGWGTVGVFGMGIPDEMCLEDSKRIFGGVRWGMPL